MQGSHQVRHALNRLRPVETEAPSDVRCHLRSHTETEPSSAQPLEVECRVSKMDGIPREPHRSIGHQRSARRAGGGEVERSHHIMGTLGSEESVRTELGERPSRGSHLFKWDGHEAEVDLHSDSLARRTTAPTDNGPRPIGSSLTSWR